MFGKYSDVFQPNAENYFPGEFWSYRRMIDWYSLPHLHTKHKKQERLNIEKKYGKNNPFTKSMLYGEFQGSVEGNEIFSEEDIKRMKQAMREPMEPEKGDVRAAGDIANSHDKQVLMVREGTEVLYIDEHSRGTDIEQGEYWVEVLKELEIEPWQFTLDGGGIGATVGNYMELRLNYAGINMFMANNSPTIDYQFYDRYTELHWVIKQLLVLGKLKIPFCQQLLVEMRERQYVEMDGEKIKCEPKRAHRKRCEGRSPDFLDTLVYLFHDFPAHLIMEGRALQGAIERATAPKREKLSLLEKQAAEKVQPSLEAFGEYEPMPDLDFYRNSTGI